MKAIKRCEVYYIVHDPNEAEYPDMPLSVLEKIQVDQVVSVAGMANAIQEIKKYVKLKK
jgi:two-component system chemotaxis response regulator CheB